MKYNLNHFPEVMNKIQATPILFAVMLCVVLYIFVSFLAVLTL